MEKAQIQSVAQFFFYTLFEKNLVFKASSDTIDYCRKELARSEKKILPNSYIVKATYKFWKKYKDQKLRPIIELQRIKEPFFVNNNLNYSAWKQFLKDEHPNISLVVVWACLLGFSEKDISDGMEVSCGTVRYRAGKGLKDLSTELTPGAGHA